MTLFLFMLLFILIIAGLMAGYPVAFVLAGASLNTALLGVMLGYFDSAYLYAFPNRIYGIMTNDLLIAIPLFVFMGVMLERAKIAEELLETMSRLFGELRAGLGIAVMIVGALLAASTGIVGATVITMGLISLPTMLKSNYNTQIATGTICAAGTLGQIIPPSIVLILLGDQISNAYQTAQMKLGVLSPEPVSVADLFLGALLPGIGLIILYILWLFIYSILYPDNVPPRQHTKSVPIAHVIRAIVPPILLIAAVLGSILSGFTTATESASIGALGALLLALSRNQLNLNALTEVTHKTTKVTAMVFTILIGAAMFSLVFRGLGGDDIVHHYLSNLSGGLFIAMLLTMCVMFVLGFFLDFIEIILVVVPIVAPVLLLMGADPIWLAIMIAINLQTSFLTPPFGFALFYLRGVAPDHIPTSDIYKGVIPFIAIQLIMLAILASYPSLANWLPDLVYGTENSTGSWKMKDSFVIHDVDW